MGSLEPGREINYLTDENDYVWGHYVGDRSIKRWLVGGPPAYKNPKEAVEISKMIDLANYNNTLKLKLKECMQLYYLIKEYNIK